ncbi:MAG: hypothetical protein VX874_15695 [Pseudomonadota bacterium]|nr:hypothetical protein [Pseudomonadota bacterium]
MSDQGKLTREARFDDEGELDEFVAADVATLHLEQMDRGHWNLIVAHADGGETMIDLTTKRPRATRIGAMITTDYDEVPG